MYKVITILKYRDPEPFDWYQRFSGLKYIITTHIEKSQKILNVGASGRTQLNLQQGEHSHLGAGSRRWSRGICFFELLPELPGPEAELP